MFSLKSLKVKELIKQALIEDIGPGDITTECLISPDKKLKASYVTREDGIVAGLPLLQIIFSELTPDIKVKTFVKEGDKIFSGQKIAEVNGHARSILKGERLSLNFLQRMSAIAAKTSQYQDKISPYKAKICATRKTCPNFRIFEKYSVCIGGGSSHRFGLYDGVMIKDNHITAAGSIKKAISIVRENVPHTVKIEVETENIEQVKESIESGTDIIMLDNMPVEIMKKAVSLIGDKALTEASGLVNLDNINEIASIGVDYISSSAITAKAGILDIGLDII